MPEFRPHHRPAGQLLAARLDRLDEQLVSLRGQVNDAVAQALGQSIGGAIRDLLLAALSPPASASPFGRYGDADRHGWRESNRHDWSADPYDPWPAGPEPYGGPLGPDPPQPIWTPALWPVSIAAGLRAGSWWLRRGAGPCPTLAAVLLGIAVALVARSAGPLADDALTLAEVAGQLSGLGRLAGSGADKLSH